MIVGIGSWRGTGATTTALAVTSSLVTLGHHPWLVEADPAGGVLAARLPRRSVVAGRLETVAFPDGIGISATPADRLRAAAADVAGMRVITGPGDSFRAWACHSPRQPWAQALRDLDGPVVVDLGRLRGGGPVTEVLRQLDLLLLVTDSDAVSITTAADWATALGRVAPLDIPLALDITRFVVVDTPDALDRVGRSQAETELGTRLLGWLPWEPEAVRALYDTVPLTDRRLRRFGLVPAAQQLADRLVRLVGTEAAA
ncbi:MAG: hypothetical protein U0Q03_20280 [Acidimicrobiales bacterium]